MFLENVQKAIRLVGSATIQFGGHSREIRPPREIPESESDKPIDLAAVNHPNLDLDGDDDSEHPDDYGGLD